MKDTVRWILFFSYLLIFNVIIWNQPLSAPGPSFCLGDWSCLLCSLSVEHFIKRQGWWWLGSAPDRWGHAHSLSCWLELALSFLLPVPSSFLCNFPALRNAFFILCLSGNKQKNECQVTQILHAQQVKVVKHCQVSCESFWSVLFTLPGEC